MDHIVLFVFEAQQGDQVLLYLFEIYVGETRTGIWRWIYQWGITNLKSCKAELRWAKLSFSIYLWY